MTVRTRAQLNSDADTALPDNTSGDISPEDVRNRVKDLADSAKLAEDLLPQTPASASGPASIQFHEDTDNGTHKVELKAPDALSSDVTVVLPNTSGILEFIPAGLIMFSPMGSVPTGWLACEGGTFSSSTYPALYAYLGNSTTLPDMRDRVARGAGTLAGSSGATQEDAFQGHYHDYATDNNTAGGGGGPSGNGGGSPSTNGTTVRAPRSDGANGTPRTATETRVKAYIGKWVIKAH